MKEIELQRLIKYSNFVYRVYQWCKTQGLVKAVSGVYANTIDLIDAYGMTMNNHITIYLYSIITANTKMINDLIEQDLLDEEYRESLMYNFTKIDIIFTLIHEIYHQYVPTSCYSYVNDKEYNQYIEDKVNYSTHLFIMENKDIIDGKFQVLIHEDLLDSHSEGIDTIIKRNKIMFRIDPNDYSLIFNLLDNFEIDLDLETKDEICKNDIINFILEYADNEKMLYNYAIKYYQNINYENINIVNRLTLNREYRLVSVTVKNGIVNIYFQVRYKLYQPYSKVLYQPYTRIERNEK